MYAKEKIYGAVEWSRLRQYVESGLLPIVVLATISGIVSILLDFWIAIRSGKQASRDRKTKTQGKDSFPQNDADISRNFHLFLFCAFAILGEYQGRSKLVSSSSYPPLPDGQQSLPLLALPSFLQSLSRFSK